MSIHSVHYDYAADRVTVTCGSETGPTIIFDRAAGSVTRNGVVEAVASVEEEAVLDAGHTRYLSAMGWPAPTAARQRELYLYADEYQRVNGPLAPRVRVERTDGTSRN